MSRRWRLRLLALGCLVTLVVATAVLPRSSGTSSATKLVTSSGSPPPPTPAAGSTQTPAAAPADAGPGVGSAAGVAADVVGPRQTSAPTTRPSRADSVAAPAPPAAPAPHLGPDTMGVDAEIVYDDTLFNRDAHLAAISSGGITYVRREAHWQEIEPNPPNAFTGAHAWQWAATDAWAQDVASHGLRWEPIMAHSAQWASSAPYLGFASEAYLPRDPGTFAAYVAAVAARYGRGGTFWAEHPSLPQLPVTTYEIWNEENAAPLGTPQAYADLLVAARSAIAAVDPQATVIVGGLAAGPTTAKQQSDDGFLRAMVAARPELANLVQGVGYHPYADTVDEVVANVVRMRRTLADIGMRSTPLYLTEVGWPTAGRVDGQSDLPEADRAVALSTVASELVRSDCNVRQFIAFTWVDYENAPTDELPPDSQLRWYGIANADASLKPTGQQYLATVRSLMSPTVANPLVRLCGS